MKLWKIALCVMAFAAFASCGIQKTPPTPSSGVWLDIPSTVKDRYIILYEIKLEDEK